MNKIFEVWHRLSVRRSTRSGAEPANGGLTAMAQAASLLACVMPPALAHGQSLDAAVQAQLEFVDGIECNVLLEGDTDNVSSLSGELQTICTRGSPAGGAGSSSAAGGGAATPASMPKVVQDRLRQDSGDNDAASAPGASAAPSTEKRGLFLTLDYESLDRDVTAFEDGYESDIWRLTAGLDAQLGGNWVLGAALQASRQGGDFANDGDFDTDSFGIVGFASLIPGENAYLDGYVGYTTQSLDRRRAASFVQRDASGNIVMGQEFTGEPEADFDADQTAAGLLLAYDFVIGNATISPRIGVDWTQTEFDAYGETGDSGLELAFEKDEETSFQSAVGYQATVAVSADFGVLLLQQETYFRHEYDNEQRTVGVSFVNDARPKRFTYQTEFPDNDFYEFSLGAVFVLPNGVNLFGNFWTLLEHDFIDNQMVSIGFRKDF